jgi:hypothetical protein
LLSGGVALDWRALLFCAGFAVQRGLCCSARALLFSRHALSFTNLIVAHFLLAAKLGCQRAQKNLWAKGGITHTRRVAG